MMAVLDLFVGQMVCTLLYLSAFPKPRVLSRFAEPHFDGDKRRISLDAQGSNVVNRAQNTAYCLAHVG